MREMYSRLMDVLYLACMWLSGLALVLMSLIIPWAVFNRYVLSTGTSWSEPVAVMLMLVFTFLGAAASYRAGAHIAVGMLVERLPHVAQAVLSRICDVLMLALSIFIVWYGYSLCQLTWNQNIAEFPVLRVGVTYMFLPIGSAVTALFVIERIICGPQNDRPLVRIGSEEKPHSIDDMPNKEHA